MDISIKEVKTKKDLMAFIKFPNSLYKECSCYVPPLNNNELDTLSKESNPAFEFCEARYWLAYSDNNVVGRVAGIINDIYNKKHNARYVRFGWLDFIENEDVLKALIQTVENWGKTLKAELIHGPYGFISFDRSGVLIDGFNDLATPFGSYNYPYYDTLLNNMGFKKETDWVEFSIKIPEEPPAKVMKTAELVASRYKLRNAVFKNKKDVLKYTDDLFALLNTAYGDLLGFVELNPKVIEKIKKEFSMILNPDYVTIVLNELNEPIGFGIAVPSMSKTLQKVGGRLFPFGFLHFLLAGKSDVVHLLLIGVRPDYQSKGVPSMVFSKIIPIFYRDGVKVVEVTRSLETNNKVTQLWSGYETRLHKKSRCYIKPVE